MARMTKEQAIDYGRCWDAALGSTGDSEFSSARTFLRMSIAALQERRWIPVSEKLPEEKVIDNYVDPSKPVLVQLKDKRMEISRYWTRFLPEPWIDLRSWHQEDVIAWMPLPEPYAEEADE